MTTISLKDFCLTGRFGQVQVGMSSIEVISVLGQPDDTIDYETGSFALIYGWYEFFCWTETQILYAIQNDHLLTWPTLNIKKKIKDHKSAIYFKNDKFEVDISFLQIGKDITFKETVNFFLQVGFKFKITEDINAGCTLEFASGVTLDFEDLTDFFVQQAYKSAGLNIEVINNRENMLLNGIRLFRP